MKTLLIGCGPSAVKSKELLADNKYDLVVGVNHACLNYPVTTNVLLESKPWQLIGMINKAFRKNQIKSKHLVVVERATKRLDPKIKRTVVTLCNYKVGEKEPDIRSIEDGIINTYLEKESVGTSIGALHYACSRGATHIDVVGCEYSWLPKEKNHFYGDDYQYLTLREGDNAELDLDCGRRTKVLYLRTAKNFGALVKNHLLPAGITVTDHSGGILKDYL